MHDENALFSVLFHFSPSAYRGQPLAKHVQQTFQAPARSAEFEGTSVVGPTVRHLHLRTVVPPVCSPDNVLSFSTGPPTTPGFVEGWGDSYGHTAPDLALGPSCISRPWNAARLRHRLFKRVDACCAKSNHAQSAWPFDHSL